MLQRVRKSRPDIMEVAEAIVKGNSQIRGLTAAGLIAKATFDGSGNLENWCMVG